MKFKYGFIFKQEIWMQQKFKSFRKWIDFTEKTKWNRFTCQGIQYPCNGQLSDPKVQAIQIQWPAHFAQNLKSISTITQKYSILYFLFQSILCNVYYWRLLKLVLSKAVTARKLHKIAIYWYSFSNFTTIFNITLLELSMHFFCFLMGSVFWNDLLILIFHFYDDAQQNMF